jgi:YidC/Oxa1 family membrane protein insertase
MDFGWGPSSMIQWLLEHVHVYTDTPWWASILISVLIVRGITFPFYCKMSDNSAMMKEVNPIIVPITKRMRACQMENDQMGMMAAKAELKDVLKRSGVNRLWLFFPFTQIPVFYGFYNNLRSMADVPVPEFVNGGIAWFTDLSTSDPFFALPLATAVMVSAQFAVGGEAGANSIAKSMKTVLMIVVPGVSFAFTHSWPVAIVFYIACSTAWGLMQALVLKWPRFRNRFNLYPLNPAQSVNPLGHLNVAKATPAKVEPNPNAKKQWGAEGGFLDRLTGGQDQSGEGWSVKKWQAEVCHSRYFSP